MAIKEATTGQKYRFDALNRKYKPDQAEEMLYDQLALFIPPIADIARHQFGEETINELSQIIKSEGSSMATAGLRYAVLELAHDHIYPPVGKHIAISEFDLLVTTPLDKIEEHVREAQENIEAYRANPDDIGYYYRIFNPWTPPKMLGIGSKFFYVDQRAVRGFGVITGFNLNKFNFELRTIMRADTWKWIQPIPCDYNQVKPPQGYAYAQTHQYLKDSRYIKIIGGWLDPMPEQFSPVS